MTADQPKPGPSPAMFANRKRPPDRTTPDKGKPRKAKDQRRRLPRKGGHTTFVNPYTFVPLPEEPSDPSLFRRQPAGHHQVDADRFSGRIDVELTARAPLLLRGIREGEEGLFPHRTFPETGDDPVPFLPGSSLAGTVRSLHETLAGGCLRVMNLDYRPGYRDIVQQRDQEWKLGIVGKLDKDGRPQGVLVCEAVLWIDTKLLAKALPPPKRVVTGATVNVLATPRWHTHFKRNQIPKADKAEETAVVPGEQWVVLVTDSGARAENEKCHTFWCAVARKPPENTQEVPITKEVWDDYLDAVAGADDIRRARSADRESRLERSGDPGSETSELDPPTVVEAPVTWQEEKVGTRHEARSRLFPGQVVWVREPKRGKKEKRRITGIALAAVWRHSGAHAVRERVPPPLLPCDDLNLCPTCRIFGSADTTGEDSTEARQRSYRGHLRFGDARPLDDSAFVSEVQLAPLGAPKPGAGQFYLDNSAIPEELATGSSVKETDRPLREWGSAADQPKPRQLRGRKKYWLTERSDERPFFRAKQGEWTGEMAQHAKQLNAGARFAFSVYVDGLTIAELGGLLASLDPSLLFEPNLPDKPKTGYAVGGGKPLGFGTCTARVTALDVAGAVARYTGAASSVPSVQKAVEAFWDQVLPEVQETWDAVQTTLTLDHLDPGNVWYPPATPIPLGELHVDDLESGFKGFWRESPGQQLKKSWRPLLSLPSATAPDQSLPILDDKNEDEERST